MCFYLQKMGEKVFQIQINGQNVFSPSNKREKIIKIYRKCIFTFKVIQSTQRDTKIYFIS